MCTLQAHTSGPAPGVKTMVRSVALLKAPLSSTTKLSSARTSIGSCQVESHPMLAKPWSLLLSHLHMDSSFYSRTGHWKGGIQRLWHAQHGGTFKGPACLCCQWASYCQSCNIPCLSLGSVLPIGLGEGSKAEH